MRCSTCSCAARLDSPYAVTVGELARIEVFVPDDQAEEASLVLLVDEVDEADEYLDDDRPPIRDRQACRAGASGSRCSCSAPR